MKGLKTWPNTYFERRRPVLDLNAAIRERHSTRMFLLQQPVAEGLRGCLKSHDLVNRLSMRRIAIRSISVSEVCTRCS